MSLKQFVIKLFPGLYIRKNFSYLDNADFSNYRKKNIEPELLLLKYFLKPGKNFIDIGSNKGLFLYVASDLMSPSHIYGFEPNPVLCEKIRSVFKKVKLYNCALSDKPGRAVLNIPFTGSEPDDSLASIRPENSKNNAFSFEVAVKTLDDLMKEIPGDTGLIKIDVEGHEMDVIKGAKKFLTERKPVLIVEIEQRHHAKPVKELLHHISTKYDYKVCHFVPRLNRLVDLSEDPQIYQDTRDFGTINYVNNFIFIPALKDPGQMIQKINSEIDKDKK
jgi:FkbM family methyltransferase